jgi:hypothetical protein
MHGPSPQVLGLFGEPTRETSLHAISRALLRIRSTGVTCAALGKVLACSADTIEAASNEKSLLNFESVALLGFHFPQEFSLIEALWNCRPTNEPTLTSRLDALQGQLDAVRGELGA